MYFTKTGNVFSVYMFDLILWVIRIESGKQNLNRQNYVGGYNNVGRSVCFYLMSEYVCCLKEIILSQKPLELVLLLVKTRNKAKSK